MIALWTTCENAYWREARSCSNYSWHGFLHDGQSYAPSSDSFYVIICHTGYILTAPSQIRCLRPQCGKHLRVQHSTLPKWSSTCCKYVPCDKCDKNYRNRWASYEPHAKTYAGEKHIVVQISTGVVSLQSGQSYASSSDNFNGIVCHTGCTFTADFKIGFFAPSVGSTCVFNIQHSIWTFVLQILKEKNWGAIDTN